MKYSDKPQKKLHFNELLLIIIGFMFFLNPMIILFDFIPDFIGCALIMLALHRLSSLTSDFESAFNYFKYMIAVSAARLLISLVSGQFDNVTYLSVSLILALVEAFIAYLALSALCDGLDTLNHRFDNTTREAVELRNIGVVFFVIRGLCSMLPYITSVLDKEDDTLLPGYAGESADYAVLLTLVNVVITVVFAIFLAITVIKHIGAYVKSQDISVALKQAVEEKKATQPEFFVRKNLVFAITLLAFCSLFLIDFLAGLPVGGRNFIPDFVFGIIAVWAVVLLRKQLSGYLAPLISGAVYTALSTVSFFVYNGFLSRHYYTDFNTVIKLFLGDYLVAVIFAFAETVALIVFAVMIVRYLMPVAVHFSIPDYTSEFVRLGQQTEKARRLSRRLLIGFGVFLSVIALSGTAITALFQLFDVGYDDIDFPYLLAHIVLHIAFYAYSSTLFLRLKNGVNRRFTPVPTRRE